MKKTGIIAIIATNGEAREVLFSIGQLSATPAALDLLDRSGTNSAALLNRHRTGDWGEIGREDWCANRDAITNGTRILSVYKLGAQKEPIWLITEADRSATTLLLPEEY